MHLTSSLSWFPSLTCVLKYAWASVSRQQFLGAGHVHRLNLLLSATHMVIYCICMRVHTQTQTAPGHFCLWAALMIAPVPVLQSYPILGQPVIITCKLLWDTQKPLGFRVRVKGGDYEILEFASYNTPAQSVLVCLHLYYIFDFSICLLCRNWALIKKSFCYAWQKVAHNFAWAFNIILWAKKCAAK